MKLSRQSIILCVLSYDFRDPIEGTAWVRGLDCLHHVADCVVVLDQHLVERAAVREMQITKLRGGAHSANRYPFAITSGGIRVASRGSTLIDHQVSNERVSSGVEALDAMLGGGHYRSSSVLITGAPGTAKTTLAGTFARARCDEGEPTVFVTFDEAADQLVRNLTSVGIRLEDHVRSGALQIRALRAPSAGPPPSASKTPSSRRTKPPSTRGSPPDLTCGSRWRTPASG